MELLENATDSEEELPLGWEERVTSEGLVFYANHSTKSTQWEHPVTNKKKTLTGELPYGWERKILENGNIIFVDHLNQKTSYTDPRLAYAKNSKDMRKFRNLSKNSTQVNRNLDMTTNVNYVDENSTALQLLQNRSFIGYCAIVTGGNRGVGCHVIMACRNLNNANAECESLIKQRPDISIEAMELDLASFESVKLFADKFRSKNMSLNMLFLNAAVFEVDHCYTSDNVETMFQVNYLSQFYLTRLLMDNLEKTMNSRIIAISCESHRGGNLSKIDISASKVNTNKKDFNFLQNYCNSKMCMTLFANELNRRLNRFESTAMCKAVHPGNLLPSNLFKKWSIIRYMSLITDKLAKTLPQAAGPPIYLAIAEKEFLNKENFYWNGFIESDASMEAKDSILAYRLWEISESILMERTTHFDNFFNTGDKYSSIFQREAEEPSIMN